MFLPCKDRLYIELGLTLLELGAGLGRNLTVGLDGVIPPRDLPLARAMFVTPGASLGARKQAGRTHICLLGLGWPITARGGSIGLHRESRHPQRILIGAPWGGGGDSLPARPGPSCFLQRAPAPLMPPPPPTFRLPRTAPLKRRPRRASASPSWWVRDWRPHPRAAHLSPESDHDCPPSLPAVHRHNQGRAKGPACQLPVGCHGPASPSASSQPPSPRARAEGGRGAARECLGRGCRAGIITL